MKNPGSWFWLQLQAKSVAEVPGFLSRYSKIQGNNTDSVFLSLKRENPSKNYHPTLKDTPLKFMGQDCATHACFEVDFWQKEGDFSN